MLIIYISRYSVLCICLWSSSQQPAVLVKSLQIVA